MTKIHYQSPDRIVQILVTDDDSRYPRHGAPMAVVKLQPHDHTRCRRQWGGVTVMFSHGEVRALLEAIAQCDSKFHFVIPHLNDKPPRRAKLWQDRHRQRIQRQTGGWTPMIAAARTLYDYEARILSLLGRIETAHADHLVDQLLRLDAESNRDITIFLSCQGGNLVDGLKLIDCVGLLRSSVTAVAHGLVEGPAVLFLATAHQRILFPGVVVSTAGLWDLPQLHAHVRSGIGLHQASTLESRFRAHLKERLQMALNKSAHSVEWLLELETYPQMLNATECLSLGLADAIIEGPARLLKKHKANLHEPRLSH